MKPADRSSQKKAAELFIEFQYKAFALTFDALAKALAFYFLLLGASFGIVFQARPSGQILTAVLIFSVLLTLVSGFAFAIGVKGLLGAISRLGLSMSALDSKVFLAQKLDEYFIRARRLILSIAVLCEIVLLLITGLSTVALVVPSGGPAQVGMQAPTRSVAVPGVASPTSATSAVKAEP